MVATAAPHEAWLECFTALARPARRARHARIPAPTFARAVSFHLHFNNLRATSPSKLKVALGHEGDFVSIAVRSTLPLLSEVSRAPGTCRPPAGGARARQGRVEHLRCPLPFHPTSKISGVQRLSKILAESTSPAYSSGVITPASNRARKSVRRRSTFTGTTRAAEAWRGTHGHARLPNRQSGTKAHVGSGSGSGSGSASASGRERLVADAPAPPSAPQAHGRQEEVRASCADSAARVSPPLPFLPYKVDTSRPSLRTNWTCLPPQG